MLIFCWFFPFIYRLGFSNPVAASSPKPSPADQPILVLFVIGGLTFKEVGQVRKVIGQAGNVASSKVILMTTAMTNNENLLYKIFETN